jgi:hypothetical protein
MVAGRGAAHLVALHVVAVHHSVFAEIQPQIAAASLLSRVPMTPISYGLSSQAMIVTSFGSFHSPSHRAAHGLGPIAH